MNTHTIYMNYILLIASGMSLQSDLLGPANLGEQDTPPPHPREMVGCMTVVACLKLSHYYNY